MGQRAPEPLKQAAVATALFVAGVARLALKATARWCDGAEDRHRSKHEEETTMDHCENRRVIGMLGRVRRRRERQDRPPGQSGERSGGADEVVRSVRVGCAIHDPSRIHVIAIGGPYFGLTPKTYQSGETDHTGRISKRGEASMREALHEAAHIMLTNPMKGCSELKSCAMRIARCASINKAEVALAHKIAVIMHRMLTGDVPFNPAARAASA